MPNSYLDSQSTYVDKDAAVYKRNVVATDAATRTLTEDESGTVVLATKGSATQTFTLPAVAAGLEFTFVAGSAAGEILVDQAGSEVINIKASEGGAAVATAAGTGIKNTAATNVLGDSLTLVSDGTSWYGTNQSGTWASQ